MVNAAAEGSAQITLSPFNIYSSMPILIILHLA